MAESILQTDAARQQSARTNKSPVATEDGYTLTWLRDDAIAVRNPGGDVYCVTLGNPLRCSCPGFRFRKHCKHTPMIQEAGMVAASDVLTIPGPNDVAEPERAEMAALNGVKGMARLAVALSRAQAACKAVSHDAYNQHHKYDYTSSEAIITEGKKALADAGLALLPVRQSLNRWERKGEDCFELERHFLLLHSSGDTLPLCVHWPVVPGTGRPLDKATAAASTLSLSYLLRDLLLMPRVDPADEVNARDDTPKPQERPAKPSQGREPPEPTVNEEQLKELAMLFHQYTADLKSFLKNRRIASLHMLPRSLFQRTKDWITKHDLRDEPDQTEGDDAEPARAS